MNPADFTELGFGLSALVIILIVIRYFIDSQNKKDVYIKELTDNFTTVITNHIVHDNAQSRRETAVLSKLDKSIKMLTEKIVVKN